MKRWILLCPIAMMAAPLLAQEKLAQEAVRRAEQEAFRLAQEAREHTAVLAEGRLLEEAIHAKEAALAAAAEAKEHFAYQAHEMALDLAFQIKPEVEDRLWRLQQGPVKIGREGQSEEGWYRRGTSALDNREWERAAESFQFAASAKGPRADGSLYWKAYALNKLGRRDEALAALAQLEKEHPSSRWLNDAKVLQIEVRQSTGRPVSPEQETDEELKLYAINSLVYTEPDRALPLLEKILSTSTSPKLKERALFVLAQTKTQRAMEILTTMAKGGANPDLQPKAVSYLGDFAGKTVLPMMAEIYSSATDTPLKRTILRVYMRNKDKERLLAAATSESSDALRRDAMQYLGGLGAYDELMQLYGSASTVEAKSDILRSMHGRGAGDKLKQLLSTEKEPKLRVEVIRMLGNHGGEEGSTLLLSLYGGESDPGVRKAILSALSSQNNAKALVELARKESDLETKKYIIQRLSRMRSKEANDYLVELLSR